MSNYFGKLFVDFGLVGYNFQNRLTIAPFARQTAEVERAPNDELVACYTRRARGGIGMVISEGHSSMNPDAARALESGGGDLVAVCRQLFAHPDWPHSLTSGQKFD